MVKQSRAGSRGVPTKQGNGEHHAGEARKVPGFMEAKILGRLQDASRNNHRKEGFLGKGKSIRAHGKEGVEEDQEGRPSVP